MTFLEQKKTKQVRVGDILIGGGAPLTVQSMLNVIAEDREGNIKQAKALAAAGCQIIRVAVPNMEAVRLIDAVKNAVDVPVVADIHFDYRLALECVNAGVDKIRINPGNIGAQDRIKAVANACGNHGIPIRIGVNAGSLEKEILARFGSPTAQALVASALYHASLLEQFGFDDIVLSMKSSNVPTMVQAYELASEQCAYPLHLGVTEAGTKHMGIIKSAMGIGALLLQGIGDTLRVSLTADPVDEVFAGFDILKALGLKKDSPYLISCPTCGRTKIDIITLASEVERRLAGCTKPIKIAIMGCVVNGPGEAKEADIGIAGGDGEGLLFKKGKIIRKIPENRLIDELMKEIEMMDC